MRRTGIARAFGRALALAAAVLAAAAALTAFPQTARAANMSEFQPGNIISDAIFYDGAGMNASEVQAFLNGVVPQCNPGRLCLRDYGEYTQSRSANDACAAYQGDRVESAASIIARVGAACGINPKVILVMLQKEQSLVTAKNLSWDAWAWKASMGYACPDSGPGYSASCDAEYYGFFNQVYNGVKQLKRYGISSYFNWFPVGRTVNIQYHPNPACGTKPVYISNKATAALYYYTPYTPNNAALASSYSTGDSCSSYGNRNFFAYFSDWFGSPTGYPVHGAIGAKYDSLGGANGPLGSSTSPEVCGIKDNGCYQNFARGAITWTEKGGAWATWGGIRERWRWTGFENGTLGYPIGDEVCGIKNNGCYQNFQKGAITWTAQLGAWETTGDIRKAWQATGFENGPLGYPTTTTYCDLTDGGCYQGYENGAIVWSKDTGAWGTWGAIRQRWQATGFDAGALGYPTGTTVCGLREGGCYQNYENGAITWTPKIGAWETSGEIREVWRASAFEFGPLGFPTGAVKCDASKRCLQQFQRGVITESAPSGTSATSGATTSTTVLPVWGGIYDKWKSLGGATGSLGYPTTGEKVVGQTVVQKFERGSITWDSVTSTARAGS